MNTLAFGLGSFTTTDAFLLSIPLLLIAAFWVPRLIRKGWNSAGPK